MKMRRHSARRHLTANHQTRCHKRPAPHRLKQATPRHKVTVLIDDLDIPVLHHDTGTLIRKLILEPTRDYQPRGVKCGDSPENRL
jgi:hypothetical protein